MVLPSLSTSVGWATLNIDEAGSYVAFPQPRLLFHDHVFLIVS